VAELTTQTPQPTTLITYRDAVRLALQRELARDERVMFIGEDVAAAGGVFKATPGLLEEFGAGRVRDTPISEQAIVGAAIGAAMTGLRPIVEIMFADFLATCWDMFVNQMAKYRYMSDGQVSLPLVVRVAQGGGLRFGAQHSQSVETWAMQIPGLKVVAPSNPADVLGLFAAAVRDDDPVLFCEHKALYATKGEIPGEALDTTLDKADGAPADRLGVAKVLREGDDVTLIALSAMVPKAVSAASELAGLGIEASVVDLRSLVPLDVRTVLAQAGRTGRVFTVEENPRLCGWGAEISSLITEEAWDSLRAPVRRITTPHLPLPSAGNLEDLAIPSVDRIVTTVREALSK
jgi:pyruvate/2-oxoglutarate/acetoin dehydrogenase E1 component